MRALVVHAGNIAGGVEKVLVAMVSIATSRGVIAFDIALLFDGPVADALRAAGARVHLIGPAKASRPWSVWTARRTLAALARSVEPGVAVTPSVWTLGLFGGVLRRTRLPLVHWVHDTLGTGHWTERLAARHAPDLLVCNSRYSANAAARLFPGVPHVVLYAPLAPAQPGEHREAVRRRFGASPGEVVVAQVGRAEPLKGHRVLVEALAQLGRDTHWTCWQIGAPQHDRERRYWNEVRALAVARGVADRIQFLGAQADVVSLLGGADVYCQPNTGPEAYGLTLVEAMSAGLPVVTSAIGAAPEVLEGTGNPLTPAGDAASVADALRRLVADAELRRRLGVAGAARARVLGDPGAAHDVLANALARAATRTVA